MSSARGLVRGIGLSLLVSSLLSLPACTTSSPSGAAPSGSSRLYLSVGDSYAAGFQPEGYPTDKGFAEQLVAQLADSPDSLTLLNYGCPGETSGGLVKDLGCDTQRTVPSTVSHPDITQLAAVEETLAAHPSAVRLVTVLVGGNDIGTCLAATSPLACAKAAMPALRANLTTILAGIKAKAPGAQIIGLTYPDVYLGLLLTGSSTDEAKATVSLAVFRDVLNPTLSSAYAAAGATFVDITQRSGAYAPADQTTELEGRVVPTAVAAICQNTHFCESGDIHPTTSGYAYYADQILAVMKRSQT